MQSDEYDYRLNYGKDYKKMMDKDTKYFLEEYLNQFGSYTPDQAFALTARSLGSANPIVKKAVISQLKAKGYNAMVDEAGVGGIVSPREGVEPLILFDGAKSMKEVSVRDIDSKTMAEADKQYQKWKRVAASNRSKPW